MNVTDSFQTSKGGDVSKDNDKGQSSAGAGISSSETTWYLAI